MDIHLDLGKILVGLNTFPLHRGHHDEDGGDDASACDPHQVVREVAPSAVRSAVQTEAPAAVRDAVQSVLKEVVENRTEPLRKMVRRVPPCASVCVCVCVCLCVSVVWKMGSDSTIPL